MSLILTNYIIKLAIIIFIYYNILLEIYALLVDLKR